MSDLEACIKAFDDWCNQEFGFVPNNNDDAWNAWHAAWNHKAAEPEYIPAMSHADEAMEASGFERSDQGEAMPNKTNKASAEASTNHQPVGLGGLDMLVLAAQEALEVLDLWNRGYGYGTRAKMAADKLRDEMRKRLSAPMRESGKDIAAVIQAASGLAGYADSVRDAKAGTMPSGWVDGMLQRVDKYFAAANEYYKVNDIEDGAGNG